MKSYAFWVPAFSAYLPSADRKAAVKKNTEIMLEQVSQPLITLFRKWPLRGRPLSQVELGAEIIQVPRARNRAAKQPRLQRYHKEC